MRTSDSIAALAAALCKAQQGMAGAKKDATNPHFRSKYADLASCWEAAKSSLPQNGLCVIQTTARSDGNEVVVITRLAHSSGEWIEGELALPVSKADAQGYGSALTYARRYGLCAITGIAPEDDDGNAAASAAPKNMAATLAASGSASDVNKDAFAALDEETQKFLRDKAMEVIAIYDDKGDLHGYFERTVFDTEEKLGLWSLLPSHVRRAIKDQQRAAANEAAKSRKAA